MADIGGAVCGVLISGAVAVAVVILYRKNDRDKHYMDKDKAMFTERIGAAESLMDTAAKAFEAINNYALGENEEGEKEAERLLTEFVTCYNRYEFLLGRSLTAPLSEFRDTGHAILRQVAINDRQRLLNTAKHQLDQINYAVEAMLKESRQR
jgi:hypothetical protein